jgi:hypothetical protein
MSHFTTVETKINDLACLCEALDDLEMSYSTEDLTVRGWKGATEKADMVVRSGSKYDIGVRRLQNGFYELFADWWGVETTTGKTQAEVMQPILQRYAYRKIKKEISARGFQIAQEKSTGKKEIKLTVRRWQG